MRARSREKERQKERRATLIHGDAAENERGRVLLSLRKNLRLRADTSPLSLEDAWIGFEEKIRKEQRRKKSNAVIVRPRGTGSELKQFVDAVIKTRESDE